MSKTGNNVISSSSGNVFADLDLANAEELLAKASLAHQVTSIAKHRHLTQKETAAILGTTQPKVSDLFAGKLAGFSMERLIRFLMALDRDVTLVVAPKPRSRSHASFCVVKAASAPGGGRRGKLSMLEGGNVESSDRAGESLAAEG